MTWTTTRSAIAAALLATTLGACEHSSGAGPDVRVTLPPAPDGVAVCLRQAFPEIPDRALTKRDVVRIIGEARALDRAKSACGERAVFWIDSVRRDLAR
ncbi:hypothetical protein [Methylobacterium sp. Leaf125]|uniref:hypothetical protein n=1 Tax=Methylobacterium sp. Leaf125 TaxID=1736265 RepID=UPI000A6F5929|nr:hypothetical protein [Methylobacterium sp. Leaf125]